MRVHAFGLNAAVDEWTADGLLRAVEPKTPWHW